MVLRYKAIYICLGVPIFVAIAGVTEETVVAETFQIPDDTEYTPTYVNPKHDYRRLIFVFVKEHNVI